MALKKIEIQGFKSFADRVVLEFCDGIIAIVGPNGCGKSNIADSIRWVLGEQSAKSMRGNKMQDIIFGGASNRPAMNFAEVTITITNQNGEYPLPYEEIAITRRLHRSGESGYFINKQPVRLKDIQETFLDSGLAFAMFEQGKIDQVIQLTPTERRYIFEEAAGILRFLQKKKEVLRKLEQVDLNTARVKDIHNEVEKQIVQLEQQAADAKIYKENKATFETLEKIVYATQSELIHKKIADLTKKEEQQLSQKKAISEQLEKAILQQQEIKHTWMQSEKTLRIKSEELFKLRSEKEIKNREKNSQQERIKENDLKAKRWNVELELLLQKKSQREEEHTATKRKEKDVVEKVDAFQEKIKSQSEKVNSLENKLSAMRQQQQHKQQSHMQMMQEERKFESELKQSKFRLESLQDSVKKSHDRQKNLEQTAITLTTEIEKKRSQQYSAKETLEAQKRSQAILETESKEIALQSQTQKKELEKLQKEITENRARHKVLLRLREDKEGFSSGSKRLLKESENPQSPLHNIFQELHHHISPEPGMEQAVAAALRSYAQTLVVKTKDDLHTVLSFAKANGLKEFSIICLELIPYQNQLSTHLLANISTAETLESALLSLTKFPEAAIWIKEGGYFDAQHVYFNLNQSENNVFIREAELKNLTKKLETAEQHYQEREIALKAVQTQSEELEKQKIVLEKTIRQEEIKLSECNFHLQRAQSDFEKIRAEEKQLQQELESLKPTIESITIRITELTTKHTQAKENEQKLQHEHLADQSELEKIVQLYRKEQQELKFIETEHHKYSDEQKRIQHALHIIEVKNNESQQQEKRLSEELQQSKQAQAQINFQNQDLQTSLSEIELSLTSMTTFCIELEQQVSAKETEIRMQEENVLSVRQQLQQTEESLIRLNMQKTQQAESLENLLHDLQERHHITLDECIQVKNHTPEHNQLSIDALEKKIRFLRQQLESAGDINMTAIEECDKHKVRYTFLSQQMSDLEISKNELIQIISQLDVESRRLFKDVFEQVRNNFQKNFQILFNGGEADLQFTETEDLLEAGIEIIAKPPGKQMRSISLLSGGEKCLTAMALLFAIFEVKPAPFCILDEIDAPLDDSNVHRFANVVKQFMGRSQFLIITHNKTTMSIADKLFGVSMQERGVSKLLTMEFAKNSETVESEVYAI